MKAFNLHFYSHTPCNVYVNGEMVGFIDNTEKFFIDLVVFTNQIIVACEPISNQTEMYLPISFKLVHLNNQLLSGVSAVKIIPFPNKHYDVILNFKSVVLHSKTSLINKKLGEYNVLAMIDSTSTISIFNGDNNLFSTKTSYLTDVSCELINSLIVVEANCKNEKFMLIYDVKSNKELINDCFIEIERDNKEIKVLKNLNTTLKHGKVFVINLQDSTISNYSVYLQECTPTSQQNLIPLSFLEAIKAEDYHTAKSYLHEEFNNVTNEKLQQYFNHFDDIYYNCYFLKDNVCNYTLAGKTNKNFNFYLNNNKITEIEENIL